jgi:hypothetical protein
MQHPAVGDIVSVKSFLRALKVFFGVSGGNKKYLRTICRIIGEDGNLYLEISVNITEFSK